MAIHNGKEGDFTAEGAEGAEKDREKVGRDQLSLSLCAPRALCGEIPNPYPS
jgi:hypothetical protein